MKKKYLNIVHVMFWFVITFLVALVVLSIYNPGGNMTLVLDKEGSYEELSDTETFVIKQIETVEQKIENDWYYFVATAYSADDHIQGTNSTTATGTQVREGIIAVDPDIIPLGTQIEIKGMGNFIAEDTGGKIKGNRIDIFFESKQEAKEFGRKGIWLRAVDRNIEIARLLD